jgi:hypothetical protein
MLAVSSLIPASLPVYAVLLLLAPSTTPAAPVSSDEKSESAAFNCKYGWENGTLVYSDCTPHTQAHCESTTGKKQDLLCTLGEKQAAVACAHLYDLNCRSIHDCDGRIVCHASPPNSTTTPTVESSAITDSPPTSSGPVASSSTTPSPSTPTTTTTTTTTDAAGPEAGEWGWKEILAVVVAVCLLVVLVAGACGLVYRAVHNYRHTGSYNLT